jgi:hypothetical protein
MAEIATGRANQSKSNQIKPAAWEKVQISKVHGSKFNGQNASIRGEGKTRMVTPSWNVHLRDRDYDYYYERRNRTAGCGPVKRGQTQSNPVKPNQTRSNRIKPNQTKSNL